jgi:hypothetical protein
MTGRLPCYGGIVLTSSRAKSNDMTVLRGDQSINRQHTHTALKSPLDLSLALLPGVRKVWGRRSSHQKYRRIASRKVAPVSGLGMDNAWTRNCLVPEIFLKRPSNGMKQVRENHQHQMKSKKEAEEPGRPGKKVLP